MQLAGHPGVIGTDPAATVDQQPQHLQRLVVDGLTQPAQPHPDQRDRVRVGLIGLASLAGGVDPHRCRQLRRHIHHLLTGIEQAQHQMLADALTTLDRPHPIRPLLRGGEHHGEPVRVRAEPAGHRRALAHRDPSPRSSPTAYAGPSRSPRDCCLPRLLLPRIDHSRRAGGHRFYKPSIAFSSLSRPSGGQGCAGQLKVTRRTWTAATERQPRPPQPSLGQGPICRQCN